MTDISNITASDRTVELTHPATDEGLGWHFHLRSPYSDEVRKAEREWLNKRLAKKKQNLTAESLESAAESKILAAVSGWSFDEGASFKGETPEFSPAKLREIIRDPDFKWIRDFLDTELGEFAGFFEN
jgi:hypothetical protein